MRSQAAAELLSARSERLARRLRPAPSRPPTCSPCAPRA